MASPNYPEDYPSSQSCLWLINLGQGYDVRLTFLDLDLEEEADCSYDYVSIREGVTEDAPVKAKLCSSRIPPVLITKGAMRIRFISDSDNEFSGFKATYVAYGKFVS